MQAVNKALSSSLTPLAGKEPKAALSTVRAASESIGIASGVVAPAAPLSPVRASCDPCTKSRARIPSMKSSDRASVRKGPCSCSMPRDDSGGELMAPVWVCRRAAGCWCVSVGGLVSRSWTGSRGVMGTSDGLSGAAIVVDVGPSGAAIVVVMTTAAPSTAAACLAMDLVMAGPGLSSMSPESRINKQNNVLRFILPSRGLFLVFRASDVSVECTAFVP